MRNTSLLVAPAEPAIENDLPLDLSCNSRSRSRDDDAVTDEPMMMDECDGGGSKSGAERRPVMSIGGPPSPPRSPADFGGALAELGYVAYHRHLMALERQRQWQLRRRDQDDDDAERRRRRKRAHQDSDAPDDDDDEDHSLVAARRSSGSGSPRSTASGHDDSAPDDDSDDSSHQPMDLGANPKAYKKSLMKRYRKFRAPTHCAIIRAARRLSLVKVGRRDARKHRKRQQERRQAGEK